MSSLPSGVGKFSEEGKEAIAIQLSACLGVQRTYGRQASDLPTVVKIFLSDLADYTAAQVADALQYWRKKSPEFPTPADINRILNPEPIKDKAVYVEFLNKRKRGEALSRDERIYIASYEAATLSGEE